MRGFQICVHLVHEKYALSKNRFFNFYVYLCSVSPLYFLQLIRGTSKFEFFFAIICTEIHFGLHLIPLHYIRCLFSAAVKYEARNV